MTSDLTKEHYDVMRDYKKRVLLLDFDGTLAGFTDDRMATRTYPGVARALTSILDPKRNLSVHFVSGRDIGDLKTLLCKSDVGYYNCHHVWGGHGAQHFNPITNKTEFVELSENHKKFMGPFEAQCAGIIGQRNIEWKKASVAFHGRDLKYEDQHKFEDFCKSWGGEDRELVDTGLEIHYFNGGVELRLSGINKGTAVKKIMSMYDKETYFAFLGDDKTDEDAFAAVTTRGDGVLVKQQYRETKASYWIKPPLELVKFLKEWREE